MGDMRAPGMKVGMGELQGVPDKEKDGRVACMELGREMEEWKEPLVCVQCTQPMEATECAMMQLLV